MRVADPPTAMIKEDEEQGRMAAGSTDILEFSPRTTVNVVSTIVIYSNRSKRLMYFFTHNYVVYTLRECVYLAELLNHMRAYYFPQYKCRVQAVSQSQSECGCTVQSLDHLTQSQFLQ